MKLTAKVELKAFSALAIVAFSMMSLIKPANAKTISTNNPPPIRLYLPNLPFENNSTPDTKRQKHYDYDKVVLLLDGEGLSNHEVLNGATEGFQKDKNWQRIIPIKCKTDDKNCVWDWYAIATTQEGKQGYINAEGDWLIPPIFDTAKAFSGSHTGSPIARVKQGKKWHFINPKGEQLFAKSYENVSPFSLGYAWVDNGIEKRHIMVDSEYDNFELNDGHFIDTKGNPALSNIAKQLKKQGKLLITAGQFANNGLAPVMAGEEVTMYLISETESKKTTVVSDIRYGYVNTQGEFVIEPKYLQADEFNEFGIAEVSLVEDENLLINAQGKAINDDIYKYVHDFSENGIARVTTKNYKFEGYINAKGEHLFENDDHSDGDINARILTDNSQFFDIKGNKIGDYNGWTMPFYDRYGDADKAKTLAYNDNKWGILNKQGRFIPFDKIQHDEIIIAPVTVNEIIIGYVDGLVPMMNINNEVVYFDRLGKVRYRFKKGENGNMVLSKQQGSSHDLQEKVIWQSDMPNQRIKNLFTPSRDELILDTQYRTEASILPVVQRLLERIHTEPKPYYIPNPVFHDEEETPYAVTQDAIDNDEVKNGAVIIIAEDYVSAGVNGAYSFIPKVRGMMMGQIFDDIKAELSKHYGEPSKPEDIYWKTYQWQITDEKHKDKKYTLSLSFPGGSGDGDYYEQLVLELNE